MKNLFKMLTSTVFVLLAIPMMGQDNLENWVKKNENSESVKVTIIKNRNPDTGELTQDLTEISFSADNQILYNDLVDACKKDEDKAYQVISEKKSGKVVPEVYSFRNGNNDTQFIFSFPKEGRDKKNISVTIIKREKNKKISGEGIRKSASKLD